MISLIKKTLFIFFLGITMICGAQENNIQEPDEDNILDNMKVVRPRLMTLSIGYLNPKTTGNNYFGNGVEGEYGVKWKAQLYIYKQFFVSLNLEFAKFEVIKPEFTGQYNNTQATSTYVTFGYEFLPFKDVRLGLGYGIGGSEYYNRYSRNGRSAKFTDTGTVHSFEGYIDYEINHIVGLYFNYAFRSDKMHISAPSEIQKDFDKSTFHNLGFGIKFYIGDGNAFE